jgi:hypothetical protein
MLDAALAAIVRGWPVFPLRPRDKRPAVRQWEHKATVDVDRLSAYWETHPSANVGIACGPAGLLVVDLDTKVGDVDGIAKFAELIPTSEPIATYTVETPSGGRHVYFTADADADYRNTAGKLGPGIDTRGRGGYVVAAGSTTDIGTYRLVVDLEPVAVPGWLARRLTDTPHPTPTPAPTQWVHDRRTNYSGLVATVASAANGTRNAALYWAACRLADARQHGEPIADALDELHAAAVSAGLTDTEATGTIRSALRQAGL